MAKDPAFLFYSKDWLEGTMEMTAEEKGVYIDLLAHQHQKGSLPAESKKLAKLCGLSEPEFIPIWQELVTKFIPNGSGRLVNRKLNGIVTDRLDKGYRNKIIGTLAAVVKYSNVSKEMAQKAKQTFKVDDFLPIGTEKLTEAITEWYNKRLKSIANANEYVDIEDKKGVKGEEKEGWNKMPGQEFMNLELPDIKSGSVIQLLTIAGKPVTKEQVSELWQIFKTQNFTGEKFYNSPNETYSHFINWSKNQKINGANQPTSRKAGGKSAGAYQLLDELKKDLGSAGNGHY